MRSLRSVSCIASGGRRVPRWFAGTPARPWATAARSAAGLVPAGSCGHDLQLDALRARGGMLGGNGCMAHVVRPRISNSSARRRRPSENAVQLDLAAVIERSRLKRLAKTSLITTACHCASSSRLNGGRDRLDAEHVENARRDPLPRHVSEWRRGRPSPCRRRSGEAGDGLEGRLRDFSRACLGGDATPRWLVRWSPRCNELLWLGLRQRAQQGASTRRRCAVGAMRARASRRRQVRRGASELANREGQVVHATNVAYGTARHVTSAARRSSRGGLLPRACLLLFSCAPALDDGGDPSRRSASAAGASRRARPGARRALDQQRLGLLVGA